MVNDTDGMKITIGGDPMPKEEKRFWQLTFSFTAMCLCLPTLPESWPCLSDAPVEVEVISLSSKFRKKTSLEKLTESPGS